MPKIAERIGGYVHRFIVANANTNTQMVIRSVNLLLIGLTAVSAVFDLDIVLGAFAAGFILRYLIPTGDQTMEMKHNAIAYGFLVPLFFVVSGAKVDVRAIGAQPELLVLSSAFAVRAGAPHLRGAFHGARVAHHGPCASG